MARTAKLRDDLPALDRLLSVLRYRAGGKHRSGYGRPAQVQSCRQGADRGEGATSAPGKNGPDCALRRPASLRHCALSCVSWAIRAVKPGFNKKAARGRPSAWGEDVYFLGGTSTRSITCATPLVATMSASWTTASSTVTKVPALASDRLAPWRVFAVPGLTSAAATRPSMM